jgi:hypothetical protein
LVTILKSAQLPNGGAERYTTRRIVFRQPFTLGKAPEVYPAGTYEVESGEEAVERGGYTAFVRTATMLIIPTAAGTCSRPVKGSELDDALSRDARHDEEPSETPDRDQSDRSAITNGHS